METTDQDNSVLIDSILDEALRCVRRGEIFEVEKYCQRYPELADELRVMLPALTMLEKPLHESIPPAAIASFPSPPIPLKLADFQILSEIGRGAMGVVYEAIQIPLARRVALKVMSHAGNSRVSQPFRFQREAEIAACLHHTNIIPVFEAGETAGFVYFAMQLIVGSNLQQLIAASDPAEQTTPSATPDALASTPDETVLKAGSTEKNQPLAPTEKRLRHIPISVDLSPQSCARIALQVAEGLHFAHQRGILHRDIKPSNIMLDQESRAWIADFGLAKAMDGDGLTATGDVVGTIRYLAPERFRGQSDHRSDLYALGLTLYEALEKRPAFQETDRARLISQILDGKLPEFTASVPRDLATICFKCLQQVPADRYSTANELAGDLRRFLDGRPISARPLNSATKFLRWCNRNRLIAALSALIVCGAVWGIVTSQWHSRSMNLAQAESKASSQLADRNQLELLKSVDKFCQMVSENRRLYRSDFRDLRNLLLQSVNELTAQASTQSNVSEQAKFQLANMLERLGKLKTSDDTLADSENYLLRARDLILELSPAMRESPNVAIELATIHRLLATVYRHLGKNELAQTKVLESTGILHQVLETDGLSAETTRAARIELARSHSVHGDILFELRQNDESEAIMMKSIRVLEESLLSDPDDFDSLFELASQWTRLGTLLLGNLKKWKTAEQPLGESIRLYEFLKAGMPEKPDLDYWHAISLARLAKWNYLAGQLDNAITAQRSGVAIFEEQHRQFEQDLAVQQETGIALRQLAEFLTIQDHRDPEILLLLDRSEEILALAMASDAADLNSALSLQRTYQAHADLLVRLQDPSAALEKVDLAIQILEPILEKDPAAALPLEDRYYAADSRAEILTDLSQFDAALAEWDQALKYAPAYFVSIVQMNRTKTIAKSGKFREATKQAEALLAQASEGSMQNRHLAARSAITFSIAAQVVLQEDGNPDSSAESERYAKRAIELLELYRDHGGNLAKTLENPRGLEFLVDRPDFQALVPPADSPEN